MLAMRSPSMTSVPGDNTPSGSTTSAPESTTIRTAAALPFGTAPRLRFAGPVGVQVQLAALDRQQRGLVGRKQQPIDALEQRGELPFVRRLDHEHAARLRWRKPAIVEVVAVHRDQRTPQLVRQPEVRDVRRAAKVIVLEDKQHVPL